MKFNYNNICFMDFYGACPDISAKRNDEIMKKCTIGNKKEIHKLLEKFGYITQEQLIEGNDKFKEGTTTKEYRAVQEFIAKAWERYHGEGGKRGYRDWETIGRAHV